MRGRKRKGSVGREKMKKIQEREAQIAEQVYILMKELGLEHFPAKADFYRTGRAWLYGRVCRSGGIVAWARKLRLPTALEARGREPGNNPRNKRPTLCWRCANAVPNPPKGRGCEWSMFFSARPRLEHRNAQPAQYRKSAKRLSMPKVSGRMTRRKKQFDM